MIVTEGHGKVRWNSDADTLDIGLGDVFFIGAATQVEFISEGDSDFVLYRAFVEAV